MNFILNKVFDKTANKVIDNAADEIVNTFSNFEQKDSIQINSIVRDNSGTTPNAYENGTTPNAYGNGATLNVYGNDSVTTTNAYGSGAIAKLIIILFLLYIFISSKFFTRTILVLFGKKITDSDGNPTCIGSIIQGIIFVCFYMLFVYLVNKKVI
jgi:hypothetical protein